MSATSPALPALRLSSASPARPVARFSSTSAARRAACCCERSPPLRSRSPFSPPLSLAFAVAALASERARRRDALRVSLACASELRLRVPTYPEISMAHMCDFPLNDLTHEFDSLTGGHAVTLPPGSVLNRSSWHADWGVFNLGASVSRREGGVGLCGYRERSLGSSPADLPSAGPGPSGPLN